MIHFLCATLLSLNFLLANFFVAHADAGRSVCAPLLARSGVMQGIALQSFEGEDASFATAYLNLLNLVLEGIDEIGNHAFGHTQHAQAKSLLLQKLASSPTPVNPLSELEASVTNNSSRPATPRNLTRFSPKLSTLADSGQFNFVIENLAPEDWPQIRQTAQQKLTELQAIQSSQDTARPLTKNHFVDEPDYNGDNRLHRLIRERQLAQAAELVNSPHISTRYINQRNRKGETPLEVLYGPPLSKSAEETYSMIAFEKMLKIKDALRTQELIAKNELLVNAAANNDLAQIELLYQQGAEVFHTSPLTTVYAIHEAALGDHADAVRLLLKLGANIESKSIWHQTVLINVLFSLGSHISVETVTAILEAQPNLEVTDADSLTPFVWALRHGRADLMKLLIDHGAKLQIEKLYTAFKEEIKNPDEVVKMLIELKYDLDKKSLRNGRTLLHAAVEKNDRGFVRALLEHGASLTLKDDSGKTPIKVNRKMSLSVDQVRIMDLLYEHLGRRQKQYIKEKLQQLQNFVGTWHKKKSRDD